MRLSELTEREAISLLKGDGILLYLAPFVVRVRSNIQQFVRDFLLAYQFAECSDGENFADFDLSILHGAGVSRWIRREAHFYFDSKRFFTPLPVSQAFPMFEWGLNWCIAAHCHQYLIFHAAVIEKNGFAALMPAPPGAGKSTLCAALVLRGWRLLSDELALYNLRAGLVSGLARPINLKNESIEIVKSFGTEATFTPTVPYTAKGSVATMIPPSASVERAGEPAIPKWIIAPKFLTGGRACMEQADKGQVFMMLAEQSFNYETHGLNGFEALADMVEKCDCLSYSYGRLEDAIADFDHLSDVTK